MARYRDRVKDMRRVRAGDLLPDPRNWRRHPEAQAQAMRTSFDLIGVADVVLARETPEGLMLVDGHLRSEIDEDQELPVAILDLDEEEAGILLLTLDPLAGMAETDQAAQDALIDGLRDREDEQLRALFEAVDIIPPDFRPEDAERQPRLDQRTPTVCPKCKHEFLP